MSNFATVKAITDNLEAVLKKQGLKFSREVFEDISIPASLFPLGQIFYAGEVFEYTHGQRDGQVEANITLKIIFNEKSPIDLMRSLQDWTHRVRDVITVSALNIGDLLSSKLVSRVEIRNMAVNALSAYSAFLNIEMAIRYRET